MYKDMKNRMFKGSWKGLGYLTVIAALTVHLISINWFFPFSEVFNDSPIINYDHPFHQERSMDRVRYISDGGVIWGYNPRLMAGYVDGIPPLNDGITHWANYVAKGIFGRYVVHKLWIVFLLIMPVIILPFAVSLFGFRKIWPCSLVLTVILMNSNAEIRSYYLFGMGPFVFANFISLLSVAAFWAYNKKRRAGFFLLLLLLLPLSFLFHPLSFFLLIVSFCVIFLGTFRAYRVRQWIHIIVFLSVTFLINWHWIRVFVDFQSFAESGVDFFFRTHPLKFVRDYFIDVRKLATIWITILGICGLWMMRLQFHERLLSWTFFLGVFFLWLVTYFGGLFGLSWIQPYRFNISLAIFLLPPAAYAVFFSFKRLQMLPPSARYLIVITLILMICPVLGNHMYGNYKRSVIDHETGRIRRLTTVIAGELDWMIQWIRNNTDKNARIAIQEVGAVPPIWNSHFMPLVAVRTGRELIGNYHYKAHTVYSVASIDEDFIGIPFERLTSERLKAICEQYNIKTVILHDESAKKTMRRLLPVVHRVAQYGQLEVFRINIKPSFFLVGDGELFSDLNCIKVKNATSPVTVIKYHYFKLLKANPDVPIKRYHVQNDPIGFIMVMNGDISEFEICTDYDSSPKSFVP
jgi:hypothetical protein